MHHSPPWRTFDLIAGSRPVRSRVPRKRVECRLYCSGDTVTAAGAELPVQERIDRAKHSIGKKLISAVRGAVEYFKPNRQIKPSVLAVQFVRLIDRHLRVLIAMHDKQWWVPGVHVRHRAGKLGQVWLGFWLRS